MIVSKLTMETAKVVIAHNKSDGRTERVCVCCKIEIAACVREIGCWLESQLAIRRRRWIRGWREVISCSQDTRRRVTVATGKRDNVYVCVRGGFEGGCSSNANGKGERRTRRKRRRRRWQTVDSLMMMAKGSESVEKAGQGDLPHDYPHLNTNSNNMFNVKGDRACWSSNASNGIRKDCGCWCLWRARSALEQTRHFSIWNAQGQSDRHFAVMVRLCFDMKVTMKSKFWAAPERNGFVIKEIKVWRVQIKF